MSAAGAAPEALDDKSRAPALDVPLSDIAFVGTAMRSHQSTADDLQTSEICDGFVILYFVPQHSGNVSCDATHTVLQSGALANNPTYAYVVP